MVFWRKKNNPAAQEQEERDDKILHHPNEPELEPSSDIESEIGADLRRNELEETENQILDETSVTPIPDLISIPKNDAADRDEDGGGWWSQLSKGLKKSSSKLDLGLNEIFKNKLTEDSLEYLEDLLIESDLGPKTSARLVDAIRERKFANDVTAEEVKTILADEIQKILQDVVLPLDVKKPEAGPRVYLICGVNGVGKTTTIGKLAYQLHFKQSKKVIIAAADTFRAAAIEQLQVWSERSHCKLIAKEIGADSAAVAFEAYENAVNDNADILMIDTAGRLQNKANLMAELEKMIRVLKKKTPDVPHEVILVLDATTGQNAISQVETFKQLVKVTGLVVTKLDGSAKGGVVVALADQFGVPVYAVGVGEGIEDLQPFRAEAFAKSLVGLPV